MASCDLCTSFGRTKLQYSHDLARQHAETHFLQLKTIDDGITRDQIFKKCFPRSAKTSNSGRNKLNALCRSLFPKNSFASSSRHIICDKCHDEVRIIGLKGDLLSNVIIEHACNHLRFNMYECQHCVQEFRTRGILSKHLVSEHQLRTRIGHYRSKADDFSGEITTMIKACFGNSKKRPHSNGTTLRRQDLIALCHSLFPKNSITSSSPHVICEQCNDEVRIIGVKKDLLSNMIMEHACYHLRLNVYECRHCTDEFKNRSLLSKHLLGNHQLRTSIGHYRYKVDEFAVEISTMIRTCFGSRKKPTGTTMRSALTSSIRSHTKGSNLAAERQLFCHRLVRKVADRNNAVQCRLCSKAIKAFNGRGNRSCEGIREHAYCHLPTPLFRCRLCSEAYYSRAAVRTHLQTVHALPCLDQNFECLADQYHSNILDMVKKCYDTEIDSAKDISYRDLNEKQICKSSTRSKLTLRREFLCRRLIRKHASTNDRLVQCRLCSKKLIGTHGSQRLIQHALLHVGKEMYRCKKCSKTFISRSGVSSHLKKEHALSPDRTHYQCFADQFHGDIERVLRQCYGEEGDEKEDGSEEPPISIQRQSSKSMPTAPSKLSVQRHALCLQLIREHGDRKDQRLQCRLCNKRISVKGGKNWIHGGNAMQHATMHLDKQTHRCKVCSETFISSKHVGRHIRTMHHLPMTNNYDCLGDQFHAEIVEILHQCYNKESAVAAKPFKSRTRGEASVRHNAKGSREKLERQLFCHRLVRKYINSDGKIECRVCKKATAAMKGATSAMAHATVHLKKPMYRCVVCSEKRFSFPSIASHLRQTHALLSANNYESLEDEYHSQILAQLRECYGDL